MPLLNQRKIKTDPWNFIDDGEPVPARGDIAVSFDRLVAEFKALMLHDGRLGVVFPNNLSVSNLAPYLQRLQLVALGFPAFTDGRAYSQARELRIHLNFAGELRATGNLLPDQLAFMQQVGFDYFDIADTRFSLEAWLRAAEAISLSYQPSFATRSQTAVSTARDAEDWSEQPHYG
jgi:uncharacterized protein (DUF934 family)